MVQTITKGQSIVKKEGFKWNVTPEDIYTNSDPYKAIESGKIMAKAWAKTLAAEQHIPTAQTFVLRIIESYWQKIHATAPKSVPLPLFFKKIQVSKLDKSVEGVAVAIGAAAAGLPVNESSYLLGNVYTAVLPESTRSSGGVFYTPPSLTSRLIDMAEKAGINWATSRIIDPACGGGAFLAPICQRMTSALSNKKPKDILEHIQSHLIGWEIDPFGGWLTQVFVEVALKDIIQLARIKMKPLVRIVDSLKVPSKGHAPHFDLVIGNPPYGKIKLTDIIRRNFQESLYGHPNLYGLFSHLSLQLVQKNGVVALLTPTSFLSGEYFKHLRQLLRTHSTPLEVDFVSFRKGVFEDVLQETMLATYRRVGNGGSPVKVNQIITLTGERLLVKASGSFHLPDELTSPWIFPRTPELVGPVKAMQKMTHYLEDWGYKVSTGPLVWNRHKAQLVRKEEATYYPIIWSESISQEGRFILKADKKNHAPYFKFKKGDEWLITTKPCILLQRTTAKEQKKRLIAAALPVSLLKKGVIVENHLNMIIPVHGNPAVSPEVLAVFLNSQVANEAFRSISGSVAVSAYELESFPLPAPEKLRQLSNLIKKNADGSTLEQACNQIYSKYL